MGRCWERGTGSITLLLQHPAIRLVAKMMSGNNCIRQSLQRSVIMCEPNSDAQQRVSKTMQNWCIAMINDRCLDVRIALGLNKHKGATWRIPHETSRLPSINDRIILSLLQLKGFSNLFFFSNSKTRYRVLGAVDVSFKIVLHLNMSLVACPACIMLFPVH